MTKRVGTFVALVAAMTAGALWAGSGEAWAGRACGANTGRNANTTTAPAAAPSTGSGTATAPAPAASPVPTTAAPGSGGGVTR